MAEPRTTIQSCTPIGTPAPLATACAAARSQMAPRL
eukprot:CAMPEP_0171234426 /NCGR_PEP_ID=MMETSP0790-20130122/41425_1 /TAXON_ID=2925 /ORGANISM="Alexandrium catenella, Strain OF101" /LENGTH=35 /DNA_ID= /DNA_START= /DNA_END= /DNA_ORIENTATION=